MNKEKFNESNQKRKQYNESLKKKKKIEDYLRHNYYKDFCSLNARNSEQLFRQFEEEVFEDLWPWGGPDKH